MGVGAGLYMYDVVVKNSRSLSHLLISSCFIFGLPLIVSTWAWVLARALQAFAEYLFRYLRHSDGI